MGLSTLLTTRIGFNWWAVAALPVLVYAILVGILYFNQRRLVFPVDPTPPVLAAAGVPGAREVHLATADGLDLLAWYLPPPNATAPVIIQFHGNGGTIQARADWFRVYAAAGYGALFPEYRGYGGNPGTPSEDGLYADGRAALAFVAAEGIDPKRIVLWGESLGTGVAVHLAAERPVGAVVLVVPYTRIADAAKLRYPYVPVDLLLKDRFDSLGTIGRVHVPLLIGIAGQDTLVTAAEGRTLFAAANEPKTLWEAPDSPHSDLYAAGFAPVATQFIQRWIKPTE
jgi:fermentation-respiration switch protein FrsA (DUF1100 family)